MDILVVIERRGNAVHRMSWEAMAAGQALAKALGLTAGALVLGDDVTGLAEEVASSILDEVLLCHHPLLSAYSPDGYARALKQIIESESPRYVITGHTYMARDFLPKVSAMIPAPFLADNVAFRVENGGAVFTKQVFMGKLVADVVPSGDGPCLVSFQAAAFQADAVEKGPGAPVREVAVELEESIIRSRSEEPFQETRAQVDLSAADLIVAVGRGLGKAENLEAVKELATVLGAQLAASRPVVDAGWLPSYHQVGSSGQTVNPKLYLALGISGAIQHVVGMKGSQNIVVINKDPDAPLFELADYGVVGDIHEIVPKLTEAIRAEKSA
ncbi:MAG: electron transfer flavoprotein subunit alpha/FixB family protein [Fidelibacterota bacterium]